MPVFLPRIVEKLCLILVLLLPLLADCWTLFETTIPRRQRQRLLPVLLASFDFASTSEWDKFYQDNEETFEWHSSIPLERIASYVPPKSDCLMVGCGNSKLPQVVLSNNGDDHPRIVLLDTSQTCLDQLEQVYGSSLEYQLGDATKLSQLWGDEPRTFDMILDKGLTDAILCDEGWDWPLSKLFQEAAMVLREGAGVYLLISYKLARPTKEFLTELGEKVGIDWEFDLPEDSNDRVSVSLGRRKRSPRIPNLKI